MHGNEVVGRAMLLVLVKYLCEGYGRDERVTRLVDSTRIHNLPTEKILKSLFVDLVKKILSMLGKPCSGYSLARIAVDVGEEEDI